jgi:GNAT superfamily N-acetyltransferase
MTNLIRQTPAGSFRISTRREDQDLEAIHAYLSRAYWSEGIPRETVAKAIAGSLCFGLFAPDDAQVGFARLVTDEATFAYLADVYVLEACRGLGLGRWLVATTVGDPRVAGVRRFALATRDAHSLYADFGFTPLTSPSSMMERLRQDIYQ